MENELTSDISIQRLRRQRHTIRRRRNITKSSQFLICHEDTKAQRILDTDTYGINLR